MPRFYVNLPLVSNEKYSLPDDVVRHINVLRLKISEEICLFNNSGYDYICVIISLDKRKVEVEVRDKIAVANEAQIKITLLVSLIANDKFDLIIQKAVELGVTTIIPVIAARTQRMKSEREAHKMEHWHRIIISASEQCNRAKLAEIKSPALFSAAIAESVSEVNFILSPHHITSPVIATDFSALSLLVGPEGGFTENEIKQANAAGFISLNLGKRVLRAETAAIAGLCFLHCNYGDFKL